MNDSANVVFIRLIAALAHCTGNDPKQDDHRRWTLILQQIYRLRDDRAHSFLAAINRSGLPNESPAALLARAHDHAKQLLPLLLVEQREAQNNAETQTERDKYLHREAVFDPFLGDDVHLTRDSFSGKAEIEPERPAKLDGWGNVAQS